MIEHHHCTYPQASKEGFSAEPVWTIRASTAHFCHRLFYPTALYLASPQSQHSLWSFPLTKLRWSTWGANIFSTYAFTCVRNSAASRITELHLLPYLSKLTKSVLPKILTLSKSWPAVGWGCCYVPSVCMPAAGHSLWIYLSLKVNSV